MDWGTLLEAGVTLIKLRRFLRDYVNSTKSDERAEFETELQSFLDIHGTSIKASAVIEMMALEGWLRIEKTELHASERITIGAEHGALFEFGDDSTSSTDRTKIEAHGNAQIRGSGAAIVQKPDGSIEFYVGKRSGGSS